MANLEEIVVQLTAETNQLRAELSKAIKTTSEATGKMEDAIKEFSQNSSKNISFFQTAMATLTGFLGSQVVLGAVKELKQAFSFVVEQLKEGVSGAAAQETAFVKLANSLALNGQYSQVAMKGLEDFVGEMERMTGVSDVAIASNLGVLSSLTKLNAEGLKSAQKAALDLSVALGMDLNGATMLIAKGIEGNTSAFKRYGIEVQEGATKTERLNNILTALSGTTGAAAGAMQTWEGATKGMAIAYEDILKTVGRSITQNPVLIAMIREVTAIMGEWGNEMKNTSPLMRAIADGVLTAVKTLSAFLDGIGWVIDHLRIFQAGIQVIILAVAALGDAINGTLNSIKMFGQGIVAAVTGNKEMADSLEELKKQGKGIGDVDWSVTEKAFADLSNTVNSKHAFGDLVGDLDRVAKAGEDAFGKIGTAASATEPTIRGNAAAVKELSAYQQIYNDQAKQFALGLADQANQLNASIENEQAMLDSQHEQKLISEADYWARRQELVAQQQAVELQALSDAYQAGNISAQQFLDARMQLEQNHAAQKAKLDADSAKAQDAYNKQRLSNLSSTFGQIATLQNTSSKELAAIGKAAAVAQATIDGYAAVQKALASAPPPYNFALAALVGTATAANVAKIMGVGLNKGATSVPGVGNSDTVPAMLTPGERVITKGQNEDLTAYLKERQEGAGQGPTININLGGATFIGVPGPEVGAALVEFINDALRSGSTVGFVKGAVQA